MQATGWSEPSRRRFGRVVVAGVTALTVGRRDTLGQPVGGLLRVRQSALELPAADEVFRKYAEAVKAMHELPSSDRRSWRRQAEIHPNYCAHGTTVFLPWHRHYITQFEKICGELIGDPSFALPYWDWTYQGGRAPDAFFDLRELDVTHWKDDGTGDFPMNWGPVDTRGTRGMGKGQRLQDDRLRGGNFTATRISRIKRAPQYEIFRSQLETAPHNSGHLVVGGNDGHMVSGLSPLDPLFWLHHCNVDRLWAEWQVAGNRTPRFDSIFERQFCDAAGNPVDLDADMAVDFERLGFTYDSMAAFGGPAALVAMAGVPKERVFSASAAGGVEELRIGAVDVTETLPVNAPTVFSIPVQRLAETLAETETVVNAELPSVAAMRTFRGTAEAALAGFGKPRRVRKRVYAVIRNARADSSSSPAVNVFLNCPYLTAETPYTDDHFAGSFSFFGAHAGDHRGPSAGHGLNSDIWIDITDSIERLGLADQANLRVQLVPVVADDKDESSVRAESIRIVSA
jgi:tyrosinase